MAARRPGSAVGLGARAQHRRWGEPPRVVGGPTPDGAGDRRTIRPWPIPGSVCFTFPLAGRVSDMLMPFPAGTRRPLLMSPSPELWRGFGLKSVPEFAT